MARSAARALVDISNIAGPVAKPTRQVVSGLRAKSVASAGQKRGRQQQATVQPSQAAQNAPAAVEHATQHYGDEQELFVNQYAAPEPPENDDDDEYQPSGEPDYAEDDVMEESPQPTTKSGKPKAKKAKVEQPLSFKVGAKYSAEFTGVCIEEAAKFLKGGQNVMGSKLAKLQPAVISIQKRWAVLSKCPQRPTGQVLSPTDFTAKNLVDMIDNLNKKVRKVAAQLRKRYNCSTGSEFTDDMLQAYQAEQKALPHFALWLRVFKSHPTYSGYKSLDSSEPSYVMAADPWVKLSTMTNIAL
ncbi:hypothetical protein Agub_g10194, partial [Astrephomene gubernaculifera]